MDYHPIMGITIFALSVGGAYIVGRRWAVRRRVAAPVLDLVPPEEIEASKEVLGGDALAPDAPWVERKEDASPTGS